jgi:hypothetical protein
MLVGIRNISPVPLQAGRATLTTTTAGVTVNVGSVDFPEIPAGSIREALASFTFAIGQTQSCGDAIQFVLDIPAQGSVSRVPFSILTGRSQTLDLFADDLEAGESKWTHASGIKKKKNRIDTWVISTKRFRSGGHSWFSADLGKVTDVRLDTLPVQLPADARKVDLIFYHTFEFEGGGFDGGVLEISADGGSFEDLGSKILIGGYNGDVFGFTGNPLAERAAWVGGRMGELQQVVVNLSSYAGKRVVIRFRIGTDSNVKGGGWYIDDVSLGGVSVTCSPTS